MIVIYTHLPYKSSLKVNYDDYVTNYNEQKHEDIVNIVYSLARAL